MSNLNNEIKLPRKIELSVTAMQSWPKWRNYHILESTATLQAVTSLVRNNFEHLKQRWYK